MHCNPCPHNQNDTCLKLKEIHPDRPCSISYGVTLPKSYCPLGNWWKSCSIVWVYIDDHNNGEALRYSIRAAHKNTEYHNLTVCGDHPQWYIGNFLSCKKHPNKWVDSLKKLQAIIDSPTVTETFLWMYDDTYILQPTTIEEVNNCKYGPNPPIEGHGTWRVMADTTFALLPPGNRRNYSTHYPVVFNKQLLQQVIDKYKAPYLIETLYLNLHGVNSSPITDEFQFTRDSMNWSLNPRTKILNCKVFTHRLANTVKTMFSQPSPVELL